MTLLDQYDKVHDILSQIAQDYDITSETADQESNLAKTVFLILSIHVKELHFAARVSESGYDPAADRETGPVYRDAVDDVIKLADDFKDTVRLEPRFARALEAALATFRANQRIRDRLTVDPAATLARRRTGYETATHV